MTRTEAQMTPRHYPTWQAAEDAIDARFAANSHIVPVSGGLKIGQIVPDEKAVVKSGLNYLVTPVSNDAFARASKERKRDAKTGRSDSVMRRDTINRWEVYRRWTTEPCARGGDHKFKRSGLDLQGRQRMTCSKCGRRYTEMEKKVA